ncbi:MAG TPA: GAF domain-containing SpoIIE family protein phosphatase, partial [Pyrinomonadaceae bacterium]|nr:GAF domain-containing SpoIIE family protein phosphatase [Pyrinomonadaceae bacterium]
ARSLPLPVLTSVTKGMINLTDAAQRFDELDQLLRIEELFLLQRVAQKINSTLDLETLLDQIAGDVAATFGYTRLAILLKDQEANELVIAAGWTGELCLKGTRFKIGEQTGMSARAALTSEIVYAADVRKEPFYIAGVQDTRSEVDIPLLVRGELIGIFNIQHTETNAFTPERIRLLEALAGHVAIAIANARMFQWERSERERMTRELDDARAIQTGLFPAASPHLDGFEISGVCMPCREVGGDWYDYIPLDDGRVAVVLADVAGKGIGAALLMSSTRSVVRLHSMRGLSPREVLREVNRVLVNDFPASKFVTLIYALVDASRRTIAFASAGHLPPLLVNSTEVEFLKTDAGLPLGIMECEFSEHEIELAPGSSFILYSDGITEAINSSLEEYGAQRILEHAVKGTVSVQSLLDDVSNFASGHLNTDDVTVVMIKARELKY